MLQTLQKCLDSIVGLGTPVLIGASGVLAQEIGYHRATIPVSSTGTGSAALGIDNDKYFEIRMISANCSFPTVTQPGLIRQVVMDVKISLNFLKEGKLIASLPIPVELQLANDNGGTDARRFFGSLSGAFIEVSSGTYAEVSFMADGAPAVGSGNPSSYNGICSVNLYGVQKHQP